jgi:hypothetical protein
MFLKIKMPAVLSLLFVFLPALAYSNSTIYKWKDSNGVMNFGDDRASAPAGAKVTVFQSQTETSLPSYNQSDAEDPQPSEITQGQFAVELVKELGLKKNSSPRNAVKILEEVRIAPSLGRWGLNQPMTPELTLRLRQLTVASAREGWLGLPEDKVLLAFDTSAAILGLSIPGAGPPASESSSQEEPPSSSLPPPDQEPPPMPSYDSSEGIYSTYPILAAPPLVSFVTPLPDYYPYYYWYPVLGGFWAGGFYYSGYYVLNTNRYYHDHYGQNYYNDHHNRVIGPSPSTISGQVHGRVIKNQIRSSQRPISNYSGSLRSVRSTQRISTPAQYQQRLSSLVTPVFHNPSIRVQNSHFSAPSVNRSGGRTQASYHGRSGR